MKDKDMLIAVYFGILAAIPLSNGRTLDECWQRAEEIANYTERKLRERAAVSG